MADYGIETFLVVPTLEEAEITNTQQSTSTTQVVLDKKSLQTNGTNSTVQHLLQTLEYSESNGDPDWKPEIPFGNVSLNFDLDLHGLRGQSRPKVGLL